MSPSYGMNILQNFNIQLKDYLTESEMAERRYRPEEVLVEELGPSAERLECVEEERPVWLEASSALLGAPECPNRCLMKFAWASWSRLL